MSLSLNRLGTNPRGLTVKTWDFLGWSNPNGPTKIFLGEYEICAEDFCSLIEYFLTNTNLMPDDPRRELVARIKDGLREVDGYKTLGMYVPKQTRFLFAPKK